MDSSQTLFEFRFANPRALNVMESSGVFKTFKLETNHRSNQEILDMANTVLEDIEANRYAKLRLRSNDLTPVTAQSFSNAVKLQYVHVHTLRELHDYMENYVRLYIGPYVDQCLARGEQVTFLSFKRDDIYVLQQVLTKMYPNRTIYNIAPKRPFEVTILSNYVKVHWNEVKFLKKSDIVTEVKLHIQNNMKQLMPRLKTYQPTYDFLNEWSKTAKPIMEAKYQALRAGAITSDEFFEELKRQMFSFEASTNIKQQQLLSQQNNEMKNSDEFKNSDFIVSTIHSAKGLEWNNVVILYQDQNPMDEPKKRMYYVALTRAQKTEYILAYERTKSSVIESQYDAILARLNAATVNI